MNFLGTIFRSLALVAVVLIGNISAQSLLKPTLIAAGSYVMKEKKAAELFGEEYISARKQVVIGKAVVGGVINLIPTASKAKRNHHDTSFYAQKPNSDYSFIGYVVINGALRCAGDYCEIDEKFIEKRCDEIFPESVAAAAKMIAPAALDLVYNYITMEIVKEICS